MTQNQDLTGQTIVITGATSGIGRAGLRALARRGATVIGVGRSHARWQPVERALLDELPTAKLSFVLADLASQRQVRRLAADIRQRVATAGSSQIDVLVNNAGTVSSWYKATEDGYEMQFAVNHLAGFLLTYELLPLLLRAPAGRVITISSGSHRGAKMHWTDVMYRRNYNCLAAYKQSKLANVLFTSELNRRLAGSAVRGYAADPGLVNTEIGLKGTSGIEEYVWERRRRSGVSPAEGAETMVFLAADALADGRPAIYWKDCRPARPSRYAQSGEQATRLWALSARLCGISWA